MSPALTRETALNVADIIPCTDVEGPGKRFAIWVQGCPFRCPGCINAEMQPFVENTWVEVSDLAGQIAEWKDQIEGVTFLGGEPFSQASAYGKLAALVQDMDLSVMVFTGLTLKSLQESNDPEVNALLQHTDLLIDGLFIEKFKSEERRYIGSDNQGLHILSDRYRHFEGAWPKANGGIEIRFDGETIIINGHPRPTIF